MDIAMVMNLHPYLHYHCPPLSFSLSSPSSSLAPPLSRISLHHNRHPYMARSMYRTLIRTSQPPLRSIKSPSLTSQANRFLTFRTQSSQSERVDSNVVVDSDTETLAVQRIEDAIHRIIERRSAPDWLPFVPGSSYWVPPRKGSYGISDLVEKLANSLTDEEVMSLATARGWPSSTFFVNDASPDPAEVESTSTSTSQSADEEG